MRGGEWRRGLNRAGQGTDIHGINFDMRQTRRDFFRLRPAVFVQRNVRAPAKPVVAIPFRFAVTDEDKASTNRNSFGNLGFQIYDFRFQVSDLEFLI